ncbi:MAG: right-handed parallel beta-helix repeat-containing protein, partial [Nitrososphaerota archaeon]|nr:right-handed parallel beta-helix repeat-containing protein [Nitrososphaerota archaeon]
MSNRRKVLFSIFLVLLLVPVSTVNVSFASNSGQPSLAGSDFTSSHFSNGTVVIPISLPSILSQSVWLGSVNPSTSVSLGIVLPSRNGVGLEQFINQISSPLSKEYRNFLTPQQYGELYGPSPTEANSLSSFLSSKGLSVAYDKSNPDLLLVSGTAATAESALQVSIQLFKLGGTTYYSAASGLKLPSEFSNIQTVFGLTNYQEKIPAATPMDKILGAINSSQTTPYNSVYYSPSELAQIYNSSLLLKQGYTGSGVTIAIIDAYGDPYIQQELNNFSSEFGLPQLTINQICVDGPCDFNSGIASGWNTEIALDVEWAHAMAPNAAINLYIGSNATFPLYDAVQKAVNDGVNSIISMSWGSPENSFGQSGAVAPVFGENYPWLDQVLQQAAAQGITSFASSGDWGAYDQSQSETAPYGGAIYPSTDPYVVAVGGTSLYMNVTSGYTQFPYSNATGSYGYETAWSWSDYYGGATGGGYSTLFGTPQWQTGPGLSGGGRGAPDVSWDADPQTGVIVSISNGVGAGFTYYVIGGTSVGSPSWAGSMALIDQKVGGKLGLITPEIYSILNNPSQYSKAFHDVTRGNNNPNSASVGWDPLTGVGSPNLGVLAGYLAPSGSLAVAVHSVPSNTPAFAFGYGQTIQFNATVFSGSTAITSGTVSANIVGPNGQTVASNVPLTYNSHTGINLWQGSYTIKASDPAGMWTVGVSAKSGSSSGAGFSSFSVGDGVTLFAPYFNPATNSGGAVFVLAGANINISAAVTFPSGQCCVSGGSFFATFHLNTITGKVEGKVPLQYNGTSQLWEGNFSIPYSADQGAWILVVSGTDTYGNSGSAYSWLNVGLNVILGSDAPGYILGDTMTILAAPEYPNGTETPIGNFTAVVSSGSRVLSDVPLSFDWLKELWTGTLTLPNNYPTGYYTITIGGDDGVGNSGSSTTIVLVAPYHLLGQVTVANPAISISGGSEPIVSAKITYPSGAVLNTGSVEAFVSLDMNGVFTSIGHARMTYQASSQTFVGPNIFATASVQKTTPGKYIVSVQALDANGNYGNLSTSFFVTANTHSVISISSDSQFTSANGVISGTGSRSNPYLIAGWNTSSISISSSVSSSYELLNNWVQGNSGDGIVLSTPNSPYVLIQNDYSVSNGGNGLVVSKTPDVVISGVDASNNALNGIVVSNVTVSNGGLLNSVVTNNGQNGIVLQDAPFFSVSQDAASNNGNYGFYIFNSRNVTLASDNATSNSVGVYITGTLSHGYGVAVISNGYYV